MKNRLASLFALFTLLLSGANVWATPFSSLVAFGDSLSDAGDSPSAVLSIYKLLGGNCDPYHPCPPYSNGRYSNGSVAVEHLASAVLPGGSSSANFHDFAVAGATTGIGNYGDGGNASNLGAFGLPGMSQQMASYFAMSGGAADPNALYFVWGGANDFLTLDSPLLAAQNIAGYAGALATAGAGHILVPNLPDLGLTPFVQSVGLEAVAHAFTVDFNTELAMRLGNLSVLFPTADIIEYDTFSFLNDVVLDPAHYGFSNSQDACLPSILVAPCADPGAYVFWDGFHPTTVADTLIATAFANAVPEPATMVLLVMGLFALRATASQRRHTCISTSRGVTGPK